MMWEPLLEGADAARAAEVIRTTVAAIDRGASSQEPALIGTAGMALFLAYAESSGIVDSQYAERFLEMSLQACLRESLHIGPMDGRGWRSMGSGSSH